jgi:hypothetical protein
VPEFTSIVHDYNGRVDYQSSDDESKRTSNCAIWDRRRESACAVHIRDGKNAGYSTQDTGEPKAIHVPRGC